MKQYEPRNIEPKWQGLWQETHLYQAIDDDTTRPKYYMLTEFPYPSGAGLHAGHIREYTLGDVISRHHRMLGYNVLFPMGYDAFGLPTENYAIKNKVRPQDATATNIATFRQQFDAMGLSFDWDRQVNTTDPKFYRWTQWLFLRFFEAGLAYQAEMAINWCPKEKTGLANEEVVDGRHERCGTLVEKKLLKQWMLKITDYADRLIDGLSTVDYPARIADQQINWIGRSTGTEITFEADVAHLKRAVIMHGKNETPEGKWYPWLKDQIEQAGLKCEVPALGADEVPKLADWTAKLEKVKPDENTVLIGHSRGGMAILRWLEQAPRSVRVGRVVLVGANDGDDPDKAGGDFFYGKGYNFEKIKSHSDDFVVIQSRDDHVVPFAAAEKIAAGLGVNVTAFQDKGHFAGDMKQSPEIAVPVIAGRKITVYTTRPDTLAGATFLVLAPEHPAVKHITAASQTKAVQAYLKQVQSETELGRQEEDRPKTGVFTGAYATNPVTRAKMPIWISDYVLAGYGTGAIMAVPAHDERDNAFAKAFDLPIISVINPVLTRDDAKKLTEFKKHAKIVAIVENDKGEILTINWGPKLGGRLTIGGTVEPGESAAKTAIREIAEETGYYDLEVIEIGTETMQYQYYAFSKKEGHDASVQFVHLRLLSEDKQPDNLDDSEKGNFTVEWVSRAMAERDILEPLHRYAYDKFIGGRIYTGDGLLTNSDQFDGLTTTEAKARITSWLEDQHLGRPAKKYRLRDWIFSRQHYWGEPIPIIHCPVCGAVSVPDDKLPVVLPIVDHYEPTDNGQSPLAEVKDWVNTTCPKCGGKAKRETDTMPNWAGSSWYYLRYMDPGNEQAFAGPDKMKYWGMVDLYLGGMEHTTLHLLYSRFWHQFLYDQGLVPTPEPYASRRGQGIVLASDGRKMSKSLGNVVNPTDIIARYGADALRLYVLFMAPYDESTPWSDERLNGVSRFLYRVWNLAQELSGDSYVMTGSVGYENSVGAFETEVDRMTHKTLKKVHDALEAMRFNTVISSLMEYVNFLTSPNNRRRLLQENALALRSRTLRMLILMLAPTAPHITEELWHQLGEEGSVHTAAWPMYDPTLIHDDIVTVIVQVNGKVRAQITMPTSVTGEEQTSAAQLDPNIAHYLKDRTIVKTVVVPRKLVNFVVK
jgi:leucyl-tRNA synthetase